MESAMFPGCCLAAVLALAALASPHRLAAAAAASGEGSETTTSWHVVSVKSLLPNTVCTATKGPGSVFFTTAYSAMHPMHFFRVSSQVWLFYSKRKKASHD
jgi:ABC-type sugar transport system substrate-binding protein